MRANKNSVSFVIELLLFSLILIFLCARALLVADYNWDSLAYHLPFAAFRAGIISMDSFSVLPQIAAAYDSFPSLIYYLKGALWFVIGRPEAVNLASPLSLLVFSVFCKRQLGLPLHWSALCVLAIPIVHVAISGNMTDVVANMGLSICVLCILVSLHDTAYIKFERLFWFVVGVLIAAGTKPQAIPLAGLFSGLYILLVVARMGFSDWKSYIYTLAIFIFFISLALYKPFLNFYEFGNPFYPMSFSLAGHAFPGVFVSYNWGDPAYLAHQPQIFKWLVSIVEFDAFSLRPIPYTADQGDVPQAARSLRMGGYNVSLLLFCVFVQIYFAIQLKDILAKKILFILCVLSAIVGVMPGSQELRYFSFWMIYVVVSTFFLLSVRAKSDSSLGGNYLWLAKGSIFIGVMYFILITGGAYIHLDRRPYKQLTVQDIQPAMSVNNGVCFYGASSRMAILVSLFNSKDNPLNIYQRDGIEACEKLK